MGCMLGSFFGIRRSFNSRISIEPDTSSANLVSRSQKPALESACQDMRFPALSSNLQNEYREKIIKESRFIDAIEKDDAAAIKAMLDKKEVSSQDSLGDDVYTVAHRAVRKSPKTLQLLVDYGYDVNKESQDGLMTTPLNLAVMSNNEATLSVLLKSGQVSLDKTDIDGLTSLHVACLYLCPHILLRNMKGKNVYLIPT